MTKPTATPTSGAEDRLAEGLLLHRYGDYMASRALLVPLAEGEEIPTRVRRQAQLALVRSYLADGFYNDALVRADALLASIAPEAESSDRALAGRAYFLRAEALQALGRPAEAVQAWDQFLALYPAAWEAAGQQRARALAAVGDQLGAGESYLQAAAAANAQGDVVAYVRILESAASAFQSASRFDRAAETYDAILAVAQNAPYRADIQQRAGVALAAAGNAEGAVARWRAATDEAPSTRAAHAALVELVNREVAFDLYQRGLINVENEVWFPAIDAFNAYLAGAPPEDERAGPALVGLGRSYSGAQNYPAAIDAFDRVIANYPDCMCLGEAWMGKARALAASGDGAGARRLYRTFAREYAADPLAPEALWASAFSALAADNQVEAAVDFLALADAFPASERAPAALYALGIGAFRSTFYGQAAEVLARLQADYPDYRWDAVGYWLGRAQRARGDEQAAQVTWQAVVTRAPDIYYGILSNQARNGLSGADGGILQNVPSVLGPSSTLAGDDGSQAFAEAWLASWIDAADGPLSNLPEAVAQDVDLANGRLLLDVDERGEALVALRRLFRRYQDDPRALYALSLEFERLGAHQLSISGIARLLEFSPAGLVEETPIFLQRYSYPLHFRELIVREANAHGIPPLVYFSLVRQESLFEEGARSVAAAQGLAQIIPATGQEVAQRIGFPDYTNALIYRPHINLRFGAFYLDWVRDYLNGNLVSALVGYNAGPGNSERWRARAGSDDALFVETLDFFEPRLYVQQIVRNLYHYHRLYDGL